MIISKFRLAWKGGAQEQMNILEKMALLLENILIELQRANGTLTSIDSGVTSVDGKMTTQLSLSQQIVDNTSCACNALKDVNEKLDKDALLQQQITDNTSCACNALGDVNGKLDEIIDIINNGTPPVSVYDFVLNTNSYTVTQADITKGYFDVSGVSTKDGVLFNALTTDLAATWIGGCTVMDGGIIRIGLFRDEFIKDFDTKVSFTQTESGIIQTLQVVYTLDEFEILAQPANVEYLDSRTEMTIDVVSYIGGSMVLPSVVAPWSIASYTQHLFGSEGKSFYRLKVKPNVSSFSDLVKVPLSIQISNSFGSDTAVFSISGDEFGIEPFNSNYVDDNGVKGYDPMTYNDVVRFAFVQNILSKQNGGVENVDWQKMTNSSVNAAVGDINDFIPLTLGVCKTGAVDNFAYLVSGNPLHLNLFYDYAIGLKFIVGEYAHSTYLPVDISINANTLQMGNKKNGVSTPLSFLISVAPNMHLGVTLPMQWQTDKFETFEYPLLPTAYSGNKTVGSIIPVVPELFPDSYVNRIGWHGTSLFLMQYGWSMALKNDADIIKDTYQYYLIVDNKACYAAVVIS